jgi:hypothetical protein
MPIILGNTSISGLGVGGLPAGSVIGANLASGAVTRDKVAAGQVLQVIETRDSTQGTVQNNDTQRLGTTITPTYSNSRILVMTNWASAHDNGNGWWTLTRGGSYTPIGYERKHGVGDATPDTRSSQDATYDPTRGEGSSQNAETESYMLQYIDTPNTTSPVTYYLYYRHRPEDGYRNGGTTYFNRARTNSTTSYAVSSMILMEIKV